MLHTRTRLARGAAALAATAVLAGCGVKQSYYKDLESYIVKNQYAAAQQHVQKEPDKTYPERDRLLYYFDLAMTAHLAGDYAKSNEALYAAEKAIEDLYSKSVSKQAASFLVNDNVKEYAGEDFEMVIVHLIGALNYLLMGDLEGALVEARKVDLKLKVVAERAGGKKIAYQSDAFARYLSALIQEGKGSGSTEELNEAFISYRQALEVYSKDYQANYKTPIPQVLVNDALRTATQLGFRDFEEEIRKEYAPNAPPTQKGKTSGEVVLIHYTGLAPQKVDFITQVGASCGTAILQQQEVPEADQSTVKKAMTVLAVVAAVGAAAATSGGNCNPGMFVAGVNAEAGQGATAGMRALGAVAAQGDVVTFALPDFKKRRFSVKGSEVIVANASGPGIKSDLVEDIESIAVQSLKDRMGRVIGKAIARAVVKFAIAQGAGAATEQAFGSTWGKVVKVAFAAGGAASEEADKRSWRILPAQIRMARVPLPPGKHNLTIRLLDENGVEIGTQTLENIEVKQGKKTFVRVVSMEAKGVE